MPTFYLNGDFVSEDDAKISVLDLAKSKFKVEERNIAVSELKGADEAFITSTNKEVLPVVQIANIEIGSGIPGPKTKQIMSMFGDFVKSGSCSTNYE